MSAANPTQRDLIVAHINQPQGATVVDLRLHFNATTPAMTSQLRHLEVDGRIHRAWVAGELIRWFATPELRDAWLKDFHARPASKMSRRGWARPRAVPAAVVIAKPPAQAEVIIPANVRRTICPSPTHDARFHCAPGERPFGAGFTAAGPGIDINTGRPWGAR